MENAAGNALGKNLKELSTSVFDGEDIFVTSRYQQEFEQFNETVPEQQKGYYVAFNVKEWNGAKFRLDRTTGKGKEVAFSGDGICILWLGDNKEKAKTAEYFVVISSGSAETKMKLHVSFD